MTRKIGGRTFALRSIASCLVPLTLLIGLTGAAQTPKTNRSSDMAFTDPGTPLLLPAATYASGGFLTTGVAAADINGDGRADLLVTNLSISHTVYNGTGDGTTLVLLNNGDGTFRAVGDYGSDASFTSSVAIGDVNRDGKPDMLVSNACGFANCQQRTGGTVTVRTGNGDGTFAGGDYVYGSGGGSPGSLRITDLNGDGNPDLVVSECSNACQDRVGLVGVLLGNGDATFQSAVTYSSGGFNSVSVVVADVNGDGKPDLVVANECSIFDGCPGVIGSVGVLLGNGNGTFQPAATYNSGGKSANSVAVADLNGDGKLDLVVNNLSSGTIGVMLGNGNGTFQSVVTFPNGSAGFVVVAEVNGDGKPDLVVSSGSANLVGVLLGNGDGTFQPALTFSSGGVGAGVVAVADMNGDGRLDLAVTNGCFNSNPNCSHGSVGVLLNNQQIVYTATVTNQSNGPLTGTVTFSHGATTTVKLVGGQASYTTTYTKDGHHAITATYSGDTANDASTSSIFTEYVGLAPSQTVLTTSGSPSHVGHEVTFSATVTWTYGTVPNGEPVTFFDGTTAIGTATTAGGVATFKTSSLTVKTHTIKAAYAGDATFKPSSGKVTQVVEP
jgi:hypothetical protein